MELIYKGENCILVTTKGAVVVFNPGESLDTLKLPPEKQVITLLSNNTELTTDTRADLTFTSPGEYEVADVSIKGIAVKSSPVQGGPESAAAVVYRLNAGGLSLLLVGTIHASLSEEQLEAISLIDVLVLPVTLAGSAMNPNEAVELVRLLEPKIVVPTSCSAESLQEFTTKLGAPVQESTKLKLKIGEAIDGITVYALKTS